MVHLRRQGRERGDPDQDRRPPARVKQLLYLRFQRGGGAQNTYTVDIYRNHIFTVTFDSGGGTPCSPIEVEEGFAIKEEDVPAPTKAGYSFKGWDVDLSAPITSDLTATALWTPILNKLSVTSQDEAKGTVQIVLGTGITGEQITVQATPTQDCLFRGWYSSDGQKLSSDNPYSFEMPNHDYSLEARFWNEAEEEAWIIAHGGKLVLSEDGKTLTYGLYPQTHVSDEATIASLNAIASPEVNGWYLLGGDYYAKQTAKLCFPDYKYDDGAAIVYGSTDWFLCEPIEWRVLSKEGGEALVVSSLLLDIHRYNEHYAGLKDGHYANNYKESEVRRWLNADFLDSALPFDSSYILTKTVDNSAATTNSATNPYACEDTQDKAFLLSYQDYRNASYGFSDDASRECRTTDWTRARGAVSSSSSEYLNNGCYWTRSPNSSPNSNSSYSARYVDRDGCLHGIGVKEGCCVRPGLRVKVA